MGLPSAAAQNAFYGVQYLWPSYGEKLTEQEFRVFWDKSLKYHDENRISECYRNHKAKNPDKYRPNWGEIFSSLEGASTGGRSDLYWLLESFRKVIAAAKRQDNPASTDAEVWERVMQCWMCAEIYKPPRYVDLRNDEDGQLTEWIARFRSREAEVYIEDLKDRNLHIPQFLNDCVIPLTECELALAKKCICDE